jgi:carbamoyl-phosphate synthase small subunit
VGANLEDEESARPHIESLIVREFSQISSNWRSAESAQLYLNRHKIPAIWDIDTRALVRHIRSVGALRGVVSTDGTPADQLIFEAKELPSMAGQELASRVTCAKSYGWDKGSVEIATSPWSEQMGEADEHREKRKHRVVAYDFGIKQNILRLLVDHHCEVFVVPAQTSGEDVLEMKPDGVFLSNGPGDPEPIGYAVENIRKLVGHVPVFGICLGHQLCGLALGEKRSN